MLRKQENLNLSQSQLVHLRTQDCIYNPVSVCCMTNKLLELRVKVNKKEQLRDNMVRNCCKFTWHHQRGLFTLQTYTGNLMKIIC
jgi:hypothetical protein